jgi:hypothetical protein
MSANTFLKLFGLLQIINMAFGLDESESIRIYIFALLFTTKACRHAEIFFVAEILNMFHGGVTSGISLGC